MVMEFQIARMAMILTVYSYPSDSGDIFMRLNGKRSACIMDEILAALEGNTSGEYFRQTHQCQIRNITHWKVHIHYAIGASNK